MKIGNESEMTTFPYLTVEDQLDQIEYEKEKREIYEIPNF